MGSVEFIKGEPPTVPLSISVIPGVDGEFEGPIDRDLESNLIWWIRLHIPAQLPREKRNTALVQGEFEMKNGIIVGNAFESASLDMYTGAISFLDGRGDHLITGHVLPDGNLAIVWPGDSIFSVPMNRYRPYTYRRTEEN